MRDINGTEHNIVGSDDLRHYIMASEDEPTIHPCLDNSGTALQRYDYDHLQ